MSLPIAWVLKNKYVLLVGGGEVAETRIRKLVPNEAIVVVAAPEVTPYIQSLVDDKKVQWKKREFQMSDLDMHHWTFVLTAIDDHETSREIAHNCRKRHIPVNVADVIPLCDFYFGANFEQGPLKVMVSTGSGAPRLSRRILNELSNHAAKFQYGEAITKVSALRSALRAQLPGDDPKTSQTRMLLMKTLCDKMSFPELASIEERDMAPMIRGMILSTAACPAHPIEISNASDFVEAPSRKRRKGDITENSIKEAMNDAKKEESSESSDSDSDSSESSDSDSESDSSSDSDSDNPKRSKMERIAIECGENLPNPKLPPFPFKQSR